MQPNTGSMLDVYVMANIAFLSFEYQAAAEFICFHGWEGLGRAFTKVLGHEMLSVKAIPSEVTFSIHRKSCLDGGKNM